MDKTSWRLTLIIKRIPYQPSYAISDTGIVYAIKPSGLKELKPDISNGYSRVELCGKKYYVSSLVADLFLPPKPNDSYRIFYCDGDRTNCSKENLRWLTKSEIQLYSQYTVEYRMQILGEWT